MRRFCFTSVVVASALAGVGETYMYQGVEWQYTIKNGKAIVTGFWDPNSYSYLMASTPHYVIPSHFGEVPVSELNDGLFSNLSFGRNWDNREDVDYYIDGYEIVVEGDIDRIGKGAFSGVYAGYSLVSISDSASMKVTFKGKVGRIEDGCFSDWNVGSMGGGRVVFESDVGEIGENAFANITANQIEASYSVEFRGRVGLVGKFAFCNNNFYHPFWSPYEFSNPSLDGRSRVSYRFPAETGHSFRRRLLGQPAFIGMQEYQATHAEILSTTVRASDPTVLDVKFSVNSTNDYVKVRVLAFEDGERNWTKVIRPKTFVDGTESCLGDHVAARTEHTLSWRVTEDWQIDLAKVKIEILTMDQNMALLPLSFITIPANGSNKAMIVAWNATTDEQIQNALYWLYASNDPGLTLTNGTLANGTLAYVLSKMGYQELAGSDLEYAKHMTRLESLGQAYRWIAD